MTVYYDSCKTSETARRGSFSTSPHRTETIAPKFCRRFRSTKGASKARRDHINGEIRNMRALLPISQEDQERLSYLHSMAVICTYIRKLVLYRAGPESRIAEASTPHNFLEAVPGFIVAMTREGKLLYVSENVSDYLGYLMVDVLQGDTFYDMIDSSHVALVKEKLESSTSSKEVSFVCQMHTSKAFRLQHGSSCTFLVRGRFLSDPQSSLFVALCTPTVNRLSQSNQTCYTPQFQTHHKLDMSLIQTPDSVVYHLGHAPHELIGQSWYHLIHPEDVNIASSAHRRLVEDGEGAQVEMVLRLQCKDLSWTWMYIWATKYSEHEEITCTNYPISETEAIFLKKSTSCNISRVPCVPLDQPTASALPLSPVGSTNHSPKRQRNLDQIVEGPRKKPRLPKLEVAAVNGGSHPDNQERLSVHLGTSSTLFSSPPYSPQSSPSPLWQEEHHLNSSAEKDGSNTDRPMSPPSVSPHYNTPPNTNSVTDSSGQSVAFTSPVPFPSYHSEPYPSASFDMAPTPISPGPQLVFVFPNPTSDPSVVPDYQPIPPDVYESQADCVLHPDDFGLLPLPPELQLQEVVDHPQELPVMMLPTPPPTAQEAFPPTGVDQRPFLSSTLEHEQVEISLLARQISSLANSFNAYRCQCQASGTGCSGSAQHEDPLLGWPHHTMTSCTCGASSEPVLDEGSIDCILKDLSGVLGWTQSEETQVSRHSLTMSQEPSLAALLDCLPVGDLSSSSSGVSRSMPSGPNTSPVRVACLDQSTGLYQLNQCAQHNLPQGGLAEESMY